MTDPFIPQIGPAPTRVTEDIGVVPSLTVGDNQPDNVQQPLLALERADFDSDRFRRVIHQHGKRLTWRRAMICTCRQAMTGQPKVTCTLCAGTGTRYVDPIEIRGLVQQHDTKTKIFERFGSWIDGLAQCTVEPEYRLGFRDSLEMVDALSGYYEAITKGDRSGRRSKLPAGQDVGRYRIVSIMRAIARVREVDIVLVAGMHYELTESGRIAWTAAGNQAVPDGSLVSLRYDFHPVYLVLHMPHGIRDDVTGTKVPRSTHRALPLQAGIQLDWLNDAAADKQLPEAKYPTFTATTGEP